MKKDLLLIAGIVALSITGVAQNVELIGDETRVTSYQGKSYLVTTGLRIQPPTGGQFRVNASTDGPFYIRMAQASSTASILPPNLDKNFVRVEEILKSGVTSESQVPDLFDNERAVIYGYADGLGRTIQNVLVKHSPAMNDVIQPYSFDPDGRETKIFLPYSYPSSKGAFRPSAISEQGVFYNSTPKVSQDGRPWAEIFYEKSTLNRVTSTRAPGDLWYNAAKVKSMTYNVNTVAVPKWEVNGFGLPVTTSNYPPSTIIIEMSSNEDGSTLLTYKDLRGLTIQSTRNGLTTVYVYDDIGNLVFILPPKVSGNSSPDQSALDNWAFQMKYDDRQRLIRQKSPGIDEVYNVYDDWDRLVATQDGNQRLKNPKEWTFVKYDEFNRPLMTGIMAFNYDYTTMANAVVGGHHETRSAGNPSGYTLLNSFPAFVASSVPTSESSLISIQYYDDYSFLGVTGWDAENNNFAFSNPTGFGNSLSPSVIGHITGSKSKILGSSIWLNTVVYYDKRFQIIQAIVENHLGGNDRITLEYNFAGWTTKSSRLLTTGLGNVSVLEEYEYDHMGRVNKVWHTLDGGTRTLLAAYGYNELGQLVESNLHSNDAGKSFLQSLDFRYNIQGWLSKINNSSLTIDASNDDSNDLFGMEFIYNEGVYNVVTGGNTTATTPRYGGLLSAVKWMTNNKKDSPKQRIYGYLYDAKEQLVSGLYAAGSDGNTWPDEQGLYNESNISYDINGNLTTLKRNARLGGVTGVLDDLNYNSGGTTSTNNALKTVGDAGNPYLGFVNGGNDLVTEYLFDRNGNMTFDLNNAVTEVKYNLLDLPEVVTINGGQSNATSVEFTYSSEGSLLKKIYKKGVTIESTIDYVNGIQYVNGSLAVLLTDKGRVTKYNGGWEYEYFVTDHLGNVRLVFGYLHDASVYKASMESINALVEESDFKKIAATRYTDVAPFTYNHTPRSTDVPQPDKSSRLNGAIPGIEVGPGIVLNVSVGDIIKLEVYAKYNPGSGTASDVVGSLLSAATTSLNVTAGENPSAYQGFNTYLPGLLDGINYNFGQPKAYINFVYFDSNYQNPQFGYQCISSLAATSWEKLAPSIPPSPYNGYLYIFLSNESNYNVFFDDLKVVHEKTTKSLHVTESTDYYPFGLVIEGTKFRDESRLLNSFGFQGEFSDFDERTGWNGFLLRGNYDSRLGRWQSSDPHSQFSSNYNGMGNNPINGIDPDGALYFSAGASLVGAAAGYVIGGLYGYFFDSKHTGEDALAGMGLGAIGFGFAQNKLTYDRRPMAMGRLRAQIEAVFSDGGQGSIMAGGKQFWYSGFSGPGTVKHLQAIIVTGMKSKDPIISSVALRLMKTNASLPSVSLRPITRQSTNVKPSVIKKDIITKDLPSRRMFANVSPFESNGPNFDPKRRDLAYSELKRLVNELTDDPELYVKISFKTEFNQDARTTRGQKIGLLMGFRIAVLKGTLKGLGPRVFSRIKFEPPQFGSKLNGTAPTPEFSLDFTKNN